LKDRKQRNYYKRDVKKIRKPGLNLVNVKVRRMLTWS